MAHVVEGSERNETTAEKLRYELVRIQIEGLKLELQGLRQQFSDHETRIRKVETSSTKFDFILYLSMGGGFVGLINLAMLVWALLKAVKP